MPQDVIVTANLGSEFDVGVIEANKIHVTYNGVLLETVLTELIDKVADCCDTVQPPAACCTQFLAFDSDSGFVQAGLMTQFEISNYVLGTTQTIVHDYTTSSNGVDKSTWYTPIVAYINSIPNWNMTLLQDVALPNSGKVLYKVEYSGAVGDSLEINKGEVGTPSANMDSMGFKCDPSSNSGMHTVSNEYGTSVPFGSDPFSLCS